MKEQLPLFGEEGRVGLLVWSLYQLDLWGHDSLPLLLEAEKRLKQYQVVNLIG
jgi:hypothetical protein